MWEKVNSPIFVAIVVIIALFILQNSRKPELASEIRGVYDEINSILEDGASDAEKSKAIQEFAAEIGSQIREGFKAGFQSPNGEDAEEDPLKMFLDTKSEVRIEQFKFITSKWEGRDEYIYKLTNKSKHHISQVRLNHEFIKDGELVDVENKWINEVKVLAPGESIALSGNHGYPNNTTPEDQHLYKLDDVNIIVTDFTINENL
jgi:hypothetical protein